LDFERRSFRQEEVESVRPPSLLDVIGLDDAKKAIIDAVKIPMEHPELVKRYDVKAVKGILMFGPPGNGKTLLMRTITRMLKDVTMLEISGADIAREDPAKALASIKEMFNRAMENSPSILFIDEIDGIAPKRKSASETGVQMTSEFLQEMDGLRETPGVVLVCATNRPSSLDPAILRPGRFDKLIFIEPPNEEDRKKLFTLYLKGVPASSDMDYAKLAGITSGYTGADIANVCREAKTRALNENISSGKETEITMELLEEIAKEVKPSAPKEIVDSYRKFLEKYGQR